MLSHPINKYLSSHPYQAPCEILWGISVKKVETPVLLVFIVQMREQRINIKTSELPHVKQLIILKAGLREG